MNLLIHFRPSKSNYKTAHSIEISCKLLSFWPTSGKQDMKFDAGQRSVSNSLNEHQQELVVHTELLEPDMD